MDSYIFIANVTWDNNEEECDTVVLQASDWSEATAKIENAYGTQLLKIEMEIISDMSLIQIDSTAATVIKNLNTF